MTMPRKSWRLTAAVVAIGVAALVAVVALGGDDEPARTPAVPAVLAPSHEAGGRQSPEPRAEEVLLAASRISRETQAPELAARVAALTGALEEERAARRRLEADVTELRRQVATLADGSTPAAAPTPENPGDEPSGDGEEAAARGTVDASTFVAAGFDAERARYLKQRMDDDSLDRLYLRDQAIREKWFGTPRYTEALRDLDRGRGSLRDDIGEDDFDAFLFATGRPNRVMVANVLGGSAAEAVGLEPGDSILSYDGKRMFTFNDLRTATTVGELTDDVTLQVTRGSETIELTVPRGPLGVRVDAETVPPEASR